MKLAKPCLDIGLSSHVSDGAPEFWEHTVGLPVDHVLPIAPGHKQFRYFAGQSVVKVNVTDTPPPDAPKSGYRSLWLPGAAGAPARTLTCPSGAEVRLVAPGTEGLVETAILMAVVHPERHCRFFGEALGFERVQWSGGMGVRAGKTLLLFEKGADVAPEAGIAGRGWRYITVQVFKVDEDHARVLAAGGREARPPMTMGTTARFSMVLDPDGNWIELSQRASLVGRLD